MLIVHEVMGRSCGYLTAATAKGHDNGDDNEDNDDNDDNRENYDDDNLRELTVKLSISLFLLNKKLENRL